MAYEASRLWDKTIKKPGSRQVAWEAMRRIAILLAHPVAEASLRLGSELEPAFNAAQLHMEHGGNTE